MNLLFIRIPLLDPDHFLERWVGALGWIFSWFGMILWLILMATGLYFVIGNFSELIRQSSDVLAPDNLILLYLSLVMIKICHEFGHAFACKKFGKVSGNGGQVHTMGVMFLVFFPLPYMDASSAWAFRKKWHRVVVGTAGMMVELAVAGVAAVVWANTSTGTVHIIAYNLIFVASVSTVIFNGNPLLRFDGYYILSDLLEIPNLGPRSRAFLYYVVKRYCWGLKRAHNPAHTRGERAWFVFYSIASTAYRIFICIRILLFLNDRLPEELFILVPIIAGTAIVAWVCVPLGKFVRFLATGPELTRTRFRAVGTTLAAVAAIIACLGVLPLPDHFRVEGIVEPVQLAIVHAASDGFVTDFMASGADTAVGGPPLLKAVNPRLEAERKTLVAERRALGARRRLARLHEIAAAQILDEQIQALDEKIARVEFELLSLELRPPLAGTWVSPDIEKATGVYLRRGQQIGYLANLDEVLIRATAGQAVAAMLVEHAYKQMEIRVKNRPAAMLTGEIEQILPAGQELLPSEALGYAVGGTMPTLTQDPRDTRAAEMFFEIRIKPDPNSPVRLLTGQRVVARIKMPSKPLVAQWWRSLRQLFQRRFRI
jgi:putative peptide zinc metalloprotease protein